MFFFVSLSSTNNFSAVSFFFLASPLLLLSRLLLDTCVKECSTRRQEGCAFLLFDTALICCCSFSMICSGTNNFFAASYFFLASSLLLHSRLLLGTCVKDCSPSLQPDPAFLLFAAPLLVCCFSFSIIYFGSLTAVWPRWWFSCGSSPDIIFLVVTSCLQLATDYCSWFAILTPLFLVPERVGRCGSLSLTVEAPWYPETGAVEAND